MVPEGELWRTLGKMPKSPPATETRLRYNSQVGNTADTERDPHMGKNESTGKKAASNASKVLADPKSSKAAKSAAASALTQVKDKKK